MTPRPLCHWCGSLATTVVASEPTRFTSHQGQAAGTYLPRQLHACSDCARRIKRVPLQMRPDKNPAWTRYWDRRQGRLF